MSFTVFDGVDDDSDDSSSSSPNYASNNDLKDNELRLIEEEDAKLRLEDAFKDALMDDGNESSSQSSLSLSISMSTAKRDGQKSEFTNNGICIKAGRSILTRGRKRDIYDVYGSSISAARRPRSCFVGLVRHETTARFSHQVNKADSTISITVDNNGEVTGNECKFSFVKKRAAKTGIEAAAAVEVGREEEASSLSKKKKNQTECAGYIGQTTLLDNKVLTGSSSSPVECVAMYDNTRGCYVLELVGFTATGNLKEEHGSGAPLAKGEDEDLCRHMDPRLGARHAEKHINEMKRRVPLEKGSIAVSGTKRLDRKTKPPMANLGAQPRDKEKNTKIAHAPKSGFFGVRAVSSKRSVSGFRYQAKAMVDKKLKHLGTFDSAIEAARRYDAVACQQGRKTRLNFPDEIEENMRSFAGTAGRQDAAEDALS